MNTKKKKNNNNFIIIIAVVVLVLLIGGFLLINGCSKSDKESNNTNNDEVVEKIGAKEADIIKAYGMSKNDAIEVVKAIYNTDNFEFSADINEDSKYIVSVTNTITNSIDKYLVDPTSSEKSFYLIDE